MQENFDTRSIAYEIIIEIKNAVNTNFKITNQALHQERFFFRYAFHHKTCAYYIDVNFSTEKSIFDIHRIENIEIYVRLDQTNRKRLNVSLFNPNYRQEIINHIMKCE